MTILETRILTACQTSPVTGIADLRRELGNPKGFDAAVLALADARQVIAMSDCHSSSDKAKGGVDAGYGVVLTCLARAS